MDLIATALPALSEAFALILQPTQIGFLIVGVLLGLSVGVFPGLGGIAGLSLVLPFIYGMEPVSGLALMVGLVAVIPTSDTFASVLMGIPGSSASQATVLDGFPLAKRGEAARALAAAFVSSLFGGLFGAVILTFFVLLARPLVLAFGTPELLMVTILGLAMVGTLAGRIPLKGLVAAGLGMMVGAIGAAPALGSGRLADANWPYLYDGLQLVIVGLGIFAIPEIIALLRQDRAISREGGLGAGWLDGLADWWRNKWLSLRCAFIGVVVGVIPGLGGSVVDWIAYGHTVQTSRRDPQFGSGDIRGVIGPESSNNAKEGGGLVPTLLFGIPGSGSMAVFIGGMILLGYEAGPQMITNNLDVTYTIVWSLALANVVGAGLCILLSQPIAHLTTIRFTLLVPFLFMLIAFAAFQSRQSLEDLVALAGIGLLGVFMRRFDWSRPAFLIGFVLADQAEVYTYQAAQIAKIKGRQGMGSMFEYLFSPIVLVVIAITVVSVWLGIRQSKLIMPEGDVPSGGKAAPLTFAVLLAAFLAWALIDALSISVFNDKIFPAIISGVALIACLVIIVRMSLADKRSALFADREADGEDASAPHGLWPTLAWFASLLIMTSLFGFIIAIVLFFVVFLKLRAGASWARTALLTVIGVGFILTMASLLNRDFPPGLLQHYVDLPWPLA
jgi:TctA family transporter